MIPLLHSFEKNFERSPSYKRSFYPSLKVLLVLLGLLLTGIGFASRNSLLSPYALSVSAVTTRSCIGGSTGTITASGSGGTYSNGYSYSYSINSGSYQSSGSFTGLPAGTYTIKVRDNNNTTNVASTTATVSEYAYSTGSQTLAGSNSWVGHAYGGMTLNSSYYAGSFTESETFDENFGGNTTCFQVNANLVTSSIYTEGFSVRFRMNSTKNGLYTYDLGSDDGSRLYVDGTLVYNNWSDHSFSSSPRVLMNLSGSSSLVYEYYENSGANEVAFLNPTLILANNLTTNISQTICSGGSSALISGDSFGVLPSGLTSGVYQWSYSTSLGGARTNLASGTGATFKPDLTKAPFNSPGTYYVYRSASVTSSN
ncbi:MAG: hypothetical protein ACTHK0_12715, partial [Ginsengibacter sp.]